MDTFDEEKTKERIIDKLTECRSCKLCIPECPLFNNWLTEGSTGKIQSILYYLKNGESMSDENIEDIVFSCSMCRACEDACSKYGKNLDIMSPFEEMRQLLIEKGKAPDGTKLALESTFDKGNPWGEPEDERQKWASDLDIDYNDEKVLLYAGCTASYDDRANKLLKAFVRILEESDLDFGYLGNDEPCCGGPMLRMGEKGFFEELKKNFYDAVELDGLEMIVTPCPHGYNTLKNDYDFDSRDIRILHSVQFIEEYINYEDLPALNQSVTYHDPCFLGRWNEIYDIPRDIIKEMSEGFVEMEKTRDESFCCGGGGGYIWNEDEDPEKRPSLKRIDQAVSTDADFLVTECPFCLINFEDAIKVKKIRDKMELKSVSELVAEQL